MISASPFQCLSPGFSGALNYFALSPLSWFISGHYQLCVLSLTCGLSPLVDICCITTWNAVGYSVTQDCLSSEGAVGLSLSPENGCLLWASFPFPVWPDRPLTQGLPLFLPRRNSLSLFQSLGMNLVLPFPCLTFFKLFCLYANFSSCTANSATSQKRERNPPVFLFPSMFWIPSFSISSHIYSSSSVKSFLRFINNSPKWWRVEKKTDVEIHVGHGPRKALENTNVDFWNKVSIPFFLPVSNPASLNISPNPSSHNSPTV